MLGQPVFFDIKSFGFEPDFRAMFGRRLEAKLAGFTITVDGPGNHGPEVIHAEAFGKLSQHLTDLASCDRICIAALNWTITKRRRAPGVRFAEHEYDPKSFIQANWWVPLRFASQFTTDTPYILMFVLPDGVGSSIIKKNVFGFSEQVMEGIAQHLFGPARADVSPASQHDSSLSVAITIAHAISRLSAIAFYSRQAKLALVHVNGQAAAPVSETDARTIAGSWRVIVHP